MEKTFTQDEVNELVMQASMEAVTSATNGLQAKLDEQQRINADYALKLSTITLERQAEVVGDQFGMPRSRSAQILKLLPIDPATFNPEDLAGEFSRFLGDPANRYFMPSPANATPEGGSRRPPNARYGSGSGSGINRPMVQRILDRAIGR